LVSSRVKIGKYKILGGVLLGNFIRFYNCFFDDGQYKLTIKENYFYGLLAARWSSFLQYAEVSINQINQLQTVFMNRDQSINKQKIWEVIKILSEKQVISIDYDGELTKNNKMEYDKILRVKFVEYKGFAQINKNLYDKCIIDPFYLYFVCLCIKYGGYKAKHETIAEQLEVGVTVVKEKIKYLVDNNIVKYEKGSRVKDEKGKFVSTPNAYYVIEEKEEEIEERQEKQLPIELPEFYLYKKKKYKVVELRDDIINHKNLYGQHYFYAHEFKDIDTNIYKTFCDSRVRMEKGGFNFSRLDAEWSNYLLKKEDESKPKEDDLIDNYIDQYGHALKLKSGKITNAKNCNWDEVDLIYLKTKNDYDENHSKICYEYKGYDDVLKNLIATESVKYERFDSNAVKEIGAKYHKIIKGPLYD
jgi:hypothetical protein